MRKCQVVTILYIPVPTEQPSSIELCFIYRPQKYVKLSIMRSKIFARRADNIQKWMNAAIRCQTRTRSASSQSSVITEGNPPNSIPNISSTSTEQADVSTERLLDVLKRILGPRKHEMWKSALRHLQDGHGKRNCLGGMSL